MMGIILGLSLSASASLDSSLPDAVQKVAEDNFDKALAKVSDDPESWGFDSKDDLSHATLGDGILVHFIGSGILAENGGPFLSSYEDNSIYPIWSFTIDIEGIPKTFLEVGTDDGGLTYYLFGFGGNAKWFSSAQDQFLSMIQ